MIEVDRAQRPEELAGLQGMTFPAFRHLLELEESPLLREQYPDDPVRPIALVAKRDGQPVGLALLRTPAVDQPEVVELLSVFVASGARRQGVAGALIAAAEEEARQVGAARIFGTYMTGPLTPVVERLFEAAEWGKPHTRMLSIRFTVEEAQTVPWFKGHRLRKGFTLFPWRDLTSEERTELIESQREKQWIAPDLQPWDHDGFGFEPISSLGIRYDGKVAGWVLNHQISPDTVRFTCSYLRKDLSRFGRIVPAYVESIRLLRKSDFEWCSLTVPVQHRGMCRFLVKRCAPWASHRSESRGVVKELADR